MESWMINIAVLFATLVATFAIVKNTVSKNEAAIRNHDKKLEKHGSEIVALNTKSEAAISMKDVSEEFVRKEMFYQSQLHTDSRFDDLKEFMKDEMASQKEDNQRIQKTLLEVLTHVQTNR